MENKNSTLILWYISSISGKYVHGSSVKLVDSIYGKGAFKRMVDDQILDPVDAPTVEDIYKTNHSLTMAARRYSELNDCSMKEALNEVAYLKDAKNAR